jgi:hypothetical protein
MMNAAVMNISLYSYTGCGLYVFLIRKEKNKELEDRGGGIVKIREEN